MDISTVGLILIALSVLGAYLFQSNKGQNSSIPYATYGSYPIFGHLFSFLSDRKKFLMESRQRYGESFSIKLFNQYHIFILSPTDWTTILRNSSFSFPGTDIGGQIFDYSVNSQDHPELVADNHRLFVQHLRNRDGLRPIVTEFIRRICELMRSEKMTLKNNNILSKWIKSGLLEFSHKMLFKPSTLTLYGDIDLSSIENNYRLLHENFLYFGMPFPRWIYSYFFPVASKARSDLNNSWSKNRSAPHESDFIRNRTEIYLSYSDWLSEKDHNGLQTALFYGSLGNTIPTMFWCLLYIIQDTKALETIKQEIDTHLPIFSLDDNINKSVADVWSLEQLNACIYLESAINETLRLTGGTLMFRKCYRETHIILQDGRTLNAKPNDSFAFFGVINHFDANLFPEPNKFIFDRFLHKNAENVSGFMPFGDGKSICPGRFFVKYVIKICIAMVLRFMEYKILNTQVFPPQKTQLIGIGVAPPKYDVPIKYRYNI